VSHAETIATELAVLADGLDSSAQFLTQTAGTLRGLAQTLAEDYAALLSHGAALEAEVLKLRNEAATGEATAKAKIESAMTFIERFGGIDGAHHKQWVIDQVVRVLVDDYADWVTEMKAGEDGPYTYSWDVGIAP
jgi:hypothetical protein